MALSYLDIHQHGQHSYLQLTRVVLGYRARFTVTHDHSYPNQSSAMVEVWDRATLSWHALDHVHWGMWADKVSAMVKPDPQLKLEISQDRTFTAAGWKVLALLRDRAIILLAGQ